MCTTEDRQFPPAQAVRAVCCMYQVLQGCRLILNEGDQYKPGFSYSAMLLARQGELYADDVPAECGRQGVDSAPCG